VQPLPFSIEVKDFRIGHYANGQPKSFASDLVIHDPERGEAAGYENYMAPLAMDGRRVFLSGIRETPGEPFRYLYIPADATVPET
jgi:cytochrome c biogenesis protein ResB